MTESKSACFDCGLPATPATPLWSTTVKPEPRMTNLGMREAPAGSLALCGKCRAEELRRSIAKE